MKTEHRTDPGLWKRNRRLRCSFRKKGEKGGKKKRGNPLSLQKQIKFENHRPTLNLQRQPPVQGR